MLHCRVSTAHTHFASVPLTVLYIYNTSERQSQKEPPMVVNMLLQCTRAASLGVTWHRSGRSSGAVANDVRLCSGWTETGATRVQARSPHLHKRLTYSFASPSGHKQAKDRRSESRQMPAILKQRDYCRSQRCHLSKQWDTHPPSSSVLLRR